MRPANILVVEDHELLLTALKDLLELEGYRVQMARNGVEALAAMERTRPDLIVADIMMPLMDGYAFYEAVRAQPTWLPIPFIFLTAKGDRADVLKGKELGAEDYLTKPFDTQELLVTIQSRLTRSEAIRETSAAEFERLKGQIVTVFSHEMRTPLTYVRGYTDLALEDLSAATPEDIEPFLRGIKHGADRLTNLVDDILLLVRLDGGRAADEFHAQAHLSHSLAQAVAQTVEQFAALAAQQGLLLQQEIAPNLPPVWLCDSMFADALGRLISNGIKFTHGQGKRVVVRVRTKDEWVEVAVRDEGIGISAAELARLFERFQQIDRARQEQQGVGVGLAIARELIHLHGGDIAVESAVGAGSTFIIRLPVASDLAGAQTPAPGLAA